VGWFSKVTKPLKKAAKFTTAPVRALALAPVKAVTHVAAKTGFKPLQKLNSAVAGQYRPAARATLSQLKTGAAVGAAIATGGGLAAAAAAAARSFAPAVTLTPGTSPVFSVTPAIVNAPLGPSPGAATGSSPAAPPWGGLPLPDAPLAPAAAAPSRSAPAAAGTVPLWKQPAVAIGAALLLLLFLLMNRK